MLKLENVGDQTLLIQLNHEKKENPFSRRMTQDLMALLAEKDKDDSVSSVLLTGGIDRSFSVGGDFKDVSVLSEKDKIEEYLLEIIDLYVSLLSFSKPLVIAIDHFAIGQGLQVALMGDYRIGSHRSSIAMPELKNGVACPLGSIILERMLGRAKMLRYVIDCGEISSEKAVELGLMDELTSHDNLLEYAISKAKMYGSYPKQPFSTTKRIQNGRFIADLNVIRPLAANAHVESFMAKAGQKHFNKILKKD